MILMYAGSAFVLFDVANNVVEPMNLPAWLPRIIIWVALIGFPIAVVLSWIFDITPEGIDKTKSIEDLADSEEKQPTSKRRLKVNDVIIASLLVLVGILAYPRIFGERNLNAMTFPITVINEFGEKETRRIFKEEYLTRLALFPFSVESEDSSMNWIGCGIMDAVLEDQLQFSNMMVDWEGAFQLNEQIAFAREGNYPFFLSGEIQKNGPEHDITTRLYQTSNGREFRTQNYKGTDFFSLVDSICQQVRSDLGVSELIINSTPDLPITDLLTNNLEAYGHYIKGRYSWYFDNRNLFNLNRAIQLDPTFAKAYYRIAYLCYNSQISHESAVRSINQAITQRQRLSEYSDIETRILYHQIIGAAAMVSNSLETHHLLRPQDLNLLSNLNDTYLRIGQPDKADDIALEINDLVPNHPPYQLLLGKSYLLSGKPQKSLDVLKTLLKENPSHVEALLEIGEAYLHLGDLDAAEEAFTRAIFLMPEKEKHWSKFLDHISYLKNQDKNKEFLNPFVFNLRSEYGAFYSETYIVNNQLFVKPRNQRGFFHYPISDSVFVCAWKEDYGYAFTESTISYISGKAIRVKVDHWIESNYNVGSIWVEDEMILNAKKLLAFNKTKEALTAFREANTQNPEHYYLANYIQHLEFILSPEYESTKDVFNSYPGHYNEKEIHIEDGRIFSTDSEGLTFELLPLSKDSFMVPHRDDLMVQFVKKNGSERALQYIYRDGTAMNKTEY